MVRLKAFEKNKTFWEELIAYFSLMTRIAQKTREIRGIHR
jgi:hypothetical protein